MDLYTQLAAQYPTINDVATEIINLDAILNLPKPTEAFMSDIHGEYDAFQHVLRNGSGNVKIKIAECFRDEMTAKTRQAFAFLVYYPHEQLTSIHQQFQGDELEQWYLTTFGRLVRFLAYTASKYTRSKVRKAMAKEFVYITEELLYNDAASRDKLGYYWQIITNLIVLGQADEWIAATCHTIQILTVDHFHIVGDIYDRGPAPDLVVESLIQRGSVDIQWGNHDILWIGGASGSALCIANLIRISARYNNLSILEDVYGINLRHLARFAEQYYQDNPAFQPKEDRSDHPITTAERLQITQIHQAIAMIQFKLEGPVIKRRPEFEMTDRLVLDQLSPDHTALVRDDRTYPIVNGAFATLDASDPYRLLPEEEAVVTQLVDAFVHSEKLRRHMAFLVSHGSMYRRENNNLLLHGCVPVDRDGQFVGLTISGHEYKGEALFSFLETNLREAFARPMAHDDLATDLLWYLWTGANSPLFGKHEMTTFERYFIADPKSHHEVKNPYYTLRANVDFVRQLLGDFGLDPDTGHVINGHTPVKKGQSPVMAQHKMLVIDGGFSKPYQKATGIGGYTLLDNSYGMQLVAHEPFTTKQDAIAHMTDIVSTRRVIETEAKRRTVAETDVGAGLLAEVAVLKQRLLELHQEQAQAPEA